MNNNIKKENIFNVVEVIKDDNIYLYIINNLSEELKNYIRENFQLICVGDNRDEYVSVLNDFLVRMNQKTEKQKKGTIGELLSHIFIRYNSDKFKIISSIFNLEEKSAKKSFDVVITDNEENSIWLTEVKSATVSEKESSQKKNISLIETAKNSIIDKFNKNDQSNWYNARNHASKIIKNNSNVMETIDKLYNRKIDLENHKNVILSSVVYNNNIHDKIEFDSTLRHKYKILKEGSFRKLIIFSIQQEEYKKVIEFLQDELNNCEFVELHNSNSNNNKSDYNITINDIINRKYCHGAIDIVLLLAIIFLILSLIVI